MTGHNDRIELNLFNPAGRPETWGLRERYESILEFALDERAAIALLKLLA